MPVIPKTFDKDNKRFTKNPNDVFVTPYELALSCLQTMPVIKLGTILDVGCGTGVWGMAVKQVWANTHLAGIDIQTYGEISELNPYPYDLFYWCDYLHYDFTVHMDFKNFDLIIGNPPFSSKDNRYLAEDIVLHSFDLLNDNGYLGLLLKTEFLASLRRFENIFSNHAPLIMYQLIPRPYFNNLKGSNTIEYAFFIWQKQENKETVVKWLKWNGSE